MGSGAGGALLAIPAAAAFAVALVTPNWWSGSPTVNGEGIERKTIHVGLFHAEGCDIQEEEVCRSTNSDGNATVPIDDTFEIVGYVNLGLGGLAAVLALALGIATLRLRDGRTALAKIAIVGALVAAAGAIVAIILGPLDDTKARGVELPIGWGLMVVGGAIVATIAAGPISA